MLYVWYEHTKYYKRVELIWDINQVELIKYYFHYYLGF
jgi:hypothetical protein